MKIEIKVTFNDGEEFVVSEPIFDENCTSQSDAIEDDEFVTQVADYVEGLKVTIYGL